MKNVCVLPWARLHLLLLVSATVMVCTCANAGINVLAHYRFGEDGVGTNNRPADSSNSYHFAADQNGSAVQVSTNGHAPGSTSCYVFTAGDQGFSDMGLNCPEDNVGMEIWVRTASFSQNDRNIFGTGGNAAGLNLAYDSVRGGFGGAIAFIAYVGDPYLPASTNEWVHLALVRESGVATFYVNGQPWGAASASVPTDGAVARLGAATSPAFLGGVDELRIFTFSPGQFNADELLIYESGAPVIVSEPSDGMFYSGATASAVAVAVGAQPLAYQWYWDGALLTSQTNGTLSLPSVSASQSGGYWVVVTNSGGAVTSRTATITITDIHTLAATNVPNAWQRTQIARRYGMFSHFGINTFANLEWSDGTIPASTYAPTAIDADGWVRTAKLAGMHYFIVIAKHHDGFCLWDSAYTTYDVASSGNTNDVVRLVADACSKYGIQLAIYYSLWDRHEAAYASNFDPGYINYMKNQIRELLTNYGPVCELWLDGAWDKSRDAWKLPELYDLVKTLQPGCLMGVNNTIALPGSLETSVQVGNQQEGYPMRYFPSDFRLSDPYLPKFPDPKIFSNAVDRYYLPFEATVTVAAGDHWFYNTTDTAAKSVGAICRYYDICTAQSNSFVLNLSPDRNGRHLASNTNAILQAAYMLGLAPGKLPPANLAEGKPASVSAVWNDDVATYGAGKVVDADPDSRWACGPAGTTNAWLEVDLGAPTLFDRVIVNEFSTRIQNFSLEYWNGASWNTLTNGTTIGEARRMDFPPVVGSKLRLNVLYATEAVSIYMIKVQNSMTGDIELGLESKDGQLLLDWPFGMLQHAGEVAGPYTNIPSGVGPWRVVPSESKGFYRVRL
ncbi:MAG: hypothetical protein C0404_09385 [Verrucomicrobia bacterium]|nr:hypothetical protein [Verrucomicrobiota bacterium]